MTGLPPRRRGRPTKEEQAAREAAAKAEQVKSAEETAFLDEQLAKPRRRRGTKVNPDEETLRTIFELGKLFCTQEEIAAVLGISKRGLTNFLNAVDEAREALEDGLQHAKISLRRKQLALADKNAPAAIFLGKNYLGQKDENHTNLNVTKPVQEMTEDQLLEIAQRAGRPKVEKDTVH